jgi:hypothetical protein
MPSNRSGHPSLMGLEEQAGLCGSAADPLPLTLSAYSISNSIGCNEARQSPKNGSSVGLSVLEVESSTPLDKP